jgi:hypothetical protein
MPVDCRCQVSSTGNHSPDSKFRPSNPGTVAPQFKPLIWAGAAGLAATRVLLFAHNLSDVLAGLALGVALDKFTGRALRMLRGDS